MKALWKMLAVVVAVTTLPGCFATYQNRHGGRSTGFSADVDVLGVGIDASAGIHSVGGGYDQRGSRSQMMPRLFDPCDPGLQMSGRAWVQAPVNLAGRGQVNEQAQAYVGNGGKSCHWSGSSATSYGPMGQ